MTNKINLIQKLKFNLWYFSRIFPMIGSPVRAIGKLSTTNFMKKYNNYLRKQGTDIFPLDRYKREENIPKQFHLIKSDFASKNDLKSIEMLLNHLRIPFSLTSLSEIYDSFFDKFDTPPVLIGIKLSNDELKKIKNILNKKTHKIIIFSPVNNKTDKTNLISYIDYDPLEMLPFNLGLRSEIVKKFVNILMESEFMIITGFLPPQIALRIDDVEGKNIKEYISIITKHNWIPNLGIFLDEFKNNNNRSDFISSLNKNDKVEISPHAYNAKKFLFYDFPNGRPITESMFYEKWSSIEKDFTKWGCQISPVVNAHFHAYSKENFELFKKKNIKYIFSEFFPSKLEPIPDKMYLPSGDPLCTTGQLIEKDIIQIYSGDSAACCNQSYSYYDFLMHTDASNNVMSALKRIKTKLDMSLFTGFASFITTHESLINKLSSKDLADLFDKIDDYLNNNKFKPIKTKLSEIGRACENHTNIILYSVQKKNNKYIVKLKGNSNGDFCLVYFFKGQINHLNSSSFKGEKIVQIHSDEKKHE